MSNIIFTREVGNVLKEKIKDIRPANVFVLLDENTRKNCFPLLADLSFAEDHLITIPGGENHKSLEYVAKIWTALSEGGAKRNSLLINVGGGMVTDLGGFAASCFKRGIRCINIPTTLLAQIDASVGGKTGINFNGLKNEIGVFAIPEWVIIDNRFLLTLPHRQLLSGMAEMLKHALLADEHQLAEIMLSDIAQAGQEHFLPLIKQSVAVKTAIVEADPREKGIRKALNFGHTVGHAIESVAIEENREIYHGDAVAYGMIAELYLSVRKLGFDQKHFEAIKKFIRQNYPPYQPVAEAGRLYELMLHDKKNEKENVNFTLLRETGEFEIDSYCSREEIVEALEQLTN